MSAPSHTGRAARRPPRWRRAALAVLVPAFAVLWVGGVASHWVGSVRADEGWLASAFLLLAGLIVLLGERAPRGAAALAFVALAGFAVEGVGVRTGVPFGRYVYTEVLRPQLLGVPVVMGLAWMSLVAYAAEVAGRLRLPPWPAALAAALWTTAADLVIDPLAANQLGYWTWARAGDYYGIPFTNFVGWFVTGLVACRVVGPDRRPNFWAGFVGTAILLFFALVALAKALLPVALIGFGLSAAGLLVLRRAARADG